MLSQSSFMRDPRLHTTYQNVRVGAYPNTVATMQYGTQYQRICPGFYTFFHL